MWTKKVILIVKIKNQVFLCQIHFTPLPHLSCFPPFHTTIFQAWMNIKKDTQHTRLLSVGVKKKGFTTKVEELLLYFATHEFPLLVFGGLAPQ